MRHTCLSCWHEFDASISIDELGPHTVCPKCGSSFDVDIKGEEFCLSIKSLYDKIGSLKYGEIIPDFEDGEMKYYDLYNEQGDLSCLDGEECIVDDVGIDTIVFINNCGERAARFKLTFDEADIAIFKEE
jgi:hypothetical protein